MAILKGGQLHGRLGNLVYYTRNGKPCVRSLPKPGPRAASVAQLAQRQRMKVASRYLSALAPMLRDTFKPADKRLPGLNKAVRYALREAIAGEFPDLYIQPERVLVSSGGVSKMRRAAFEMAPNGMATLMWATGQWGVEYDDIAYLLVYNVSNSRIRLIGGDRCRGEGQLSAQLDEEIRQGMAHCYGFMMDRLRRSASDSVFLGTLMDGRL